MVRSVEKSLKSCRLAHNELSTDRKNLLLGWTASLLRIWLKLMVLTLEIRSSRSKLFSTNSRSDSKVKSLTFGTSCLDKLPRRSQQLVLGVQWSCLKSWYRMRRLRSKSKLDVSREDLSIQSRSLVNKSTAAEINQIGAFAFLPSTSVAPVTHPWDSSLTRKHRGAVKPSLIAGSSSSSGDRPRSSLSNSGGSEAEALNLTQKLYVLWLTVPHQTIH